MKPANVYAYTFATPGVSVRPTEGMKDPKYGNIFNVINPEAHGPSWVFYNWDDENDIPHNEWLLDDLF